MRKHCKVIIFLSVLFFSGYLAADDCKRPHGFSINAAGDQVWFAPGNLQYQASTNTWRFAERQFDRCGDGIAGNTTVYYTDKDGISHLCNNNDVSETYEGWIDIFGWGTSGYKGCNPCNPWNKMITGPSSGGFDVNSGDNRNYDWGYYNDIYEGTIKHPKGTWRTPTKKEWDYLMKKRQVNGQAGFSVVNLEYDPSYESMYGYILYPDDFSFTKAGVAPIAVGEEYRTDISLATWQALEHVNCVFLPATCHRSGEKYPVTAVNEIWHTPWASTEGTWEGYPVRLVRDKITVYYSNDYLECGKTYRWDLGYKTLPITASGEYYDTLRGVGGCDSIISHLLLSEASAIKRDTIVHILQGETFTWDLGYKKLNFDKKGVYRDTLKNACGWDSVHFTLYLRVYNLCEGPAFSINEDEDKVIFSPGNLQYQPSTKTWRFAENQYDFIGEDNEKISETYDGWIDLFGWGTSGKGTISERSNPTEVSSSANYGPVEGNFDVNSGDNRSYDWGYLNEIYEGETKHPAGTWRTLTGDEWQYLLSTREENSGEKAYSYDISIIRENGKYAYGVLLYPDGFTFRGGTIIADGTNLTKTQWETLEERGCAFLPFAGTRQGVGYNWHQSKYWTSSRGIYGYYGLVTLRGVGFIMAVSYGDKSYPSNGFSVRLVQDGDGTGSAGSGGNAGETKTFVDIIDTLRCGNTYIWNLGYKQIEITQTEEEKEHTDEIEMDCGKVVSKLKLVRKPLVAETNEITRTICAGDTYTWDLGYEKRELDIENDYFDTLRCVQGCDSVISILHLIVKRPFDDDYSGVIHCGETYKWDYGYGKEDITEPGVYTREKKDAATGCVDTISTLHLMFSADDVQFTEDDGVIEECTYTWELSDGRKREIYEDGDYYDTIREGTCDKVIAHLKLVSKDLPPVDPCEQPMLFSINADGGKVLLAPGNLQYQASTDTWRFAPTQYDRIGKDNENISETYDGWIDLFGWGTSGKGTSVSRSYPWLTSSTNSAYGPSSGNFDVNSGDNRSFDWGYLNEIYAGETKYPAGTWRTPTKDEWQYLLTTRKVNSADPYSFVRIQYGDEPSDTVTGVIIYPDGFTFANACMSAIATGASAGITPISARGWKKLERAGCAFLPGASYRDGTSVKDYFGINANYWASTASGRNNAYKVKFYLQNGRIEAPGSDGRKYAFPIRLVKDYDATTTAIHKNFDGTVPFGESYDWSLDDGRTIAIPPQKEDEKDYYDTLIIACDSIISHLKLVLTDKPEENPCDRYMFTINADGGKVLISPGNLQYQASTNTWRFAPNQYDKIGINNQKISETYDGWIDLFGWGTSGKGTDVSRSYPWSYDMDASYGPDGTYNIDTNSGDNRSYDWGYLNEIYEGKTKYPAGIWRTLTQEEWNYLLTTRQVNGELGYSWVSYSGVKGILLYPDDFTFDKAGISSIPVGGEISTNLTSAQWAALEGAHCIFLPQTACRMEKTIRGAENEASYWSSSYASAVHAKTVYIAFSDYSIYINGMNRMMGMAVRLVKDYRDRAIVKDFNGTIIRGESYDWSLDDGRTIAIPPQKEDEKDYYDTLIIACDSIISHLKLVLTEKPEPPCDRHTFTINADGAKVQISSGNLQYQASTNTWRFAPNQYDIIGRDNGSLSDTYDGWIDLFGWGTSGYNGCNPWLSIKDPDEYGPTTHFDVNSGDNRNYDWGYYNEIQNGTTTDPKGTWRTLTVDEWQYLLNTRRVDGAIGFSWVTINYGSGTSNGLLLYPEDFSFANVGLERIPIGSSTSTTIENDTWQKLEEAGCIFLPAAGYRNGTAVGSANNRLSYWSSNIYETDVSSAIYMRAYFDIRIIQPNDMIRYNGLAVRLVKDFDGEPIIRNNKIDTIYRGESYEWELDDDRKLPITQTEDEKHYYDTVRSKITGCDSIVSHLLLLVEDKREYNPCAPHPFTINADGGQVFISSGNLQYQATTDTWRFAERQFDRVANGQQAAMPSGSEQFGTANRGLGTVLWDSAGYRVPCSNAFTSKTYGGWIDLFPWGTSGHGQKVGDKYACNFDPYSYSADDVNETYNRYGYGPSYDPSGDGSAGVWGTGALSNNIDTNSGTNRYFDWGYANIIHEKDTAYKPGTWRTLTADEWAYLLNTRIVDNNDNAFSFVRVRYGSHPTDTVTGTLLYPDDFSFAKVGVAAIPFGARYALTEIDANTWATLEKAGAIFLPSAGMRSAYYAPSNTVAMVQENSYGSRGSYHTATACDAKNFHTAYFYFEARYQNISNTFRYDAYPVRLVRDVEVKRNEKKDTIRLNIKLPQHSFSVNKNGDEVMISSGNLQYSPEKDTWRFAERQFDRCANGMQAVVPGGRNQKPGYGLTTVFWDSSGHIVPCNNLLISQTYGGWIDMFGWGTSGKGTDVSRSYPWLISNDESAYGPNGKYNIDVKSGDNRSYDWGYLNEIHEKDQTHPAGTWRTPTIAEWEFLLKTRKVNGAAGYSFARIKYGENETDTVTGTIIYPNGFTFEKAGTKNIPVGDADLTEIDAEKWQKLEKVGCVFIPAARYRDFFLGEIDHYEDDYGSFGPYWSATTSEFSGNPYYVKFDYESRTIATDRVYSRKNGLPVRLIKDVKPDTCGTYVWEVNNKTIQIHRAGNYYDTIRNVCGWDSVISHLELIDSVIKPIIRDSIDTLHCGSKYSWKVNDKTLSFDTEGDYYDTVRNVCDGDSIISHLQLVLKLNVIRKDTTDTLRCGNDYTWVLYDGRTIPINQTEKEKEHFDTVIVGCDSIISHLKLVVDPLKADEREKSETIEKGETYQWQITKTKTREITTEGTHRDTVRSVGGCDSIISILHLTFKKPEADPCEEVVHPFSINTKGGKVLLAPGNLQYQATTKTWRFAERQFDRIGDGTEEWCSVFWDNNGTMERCNNFLASETYGGWISVFAWGTSGHGQKVGDEYTEFFEPYCTEDEHISTRYNEYGYGPSYDPDNGYAGVWGPGARNNGFDTLSGSNRHFDWGYDNEIWEGNIKHKPNTWRTLTTEEWSYLLRNRNIEGIKNVEGFKDGDDRFSFSAVTLKYGDKSTDTVTGILLYPDDFSFATAGVDAISLGIESAKKGPYTRIDLITWEKLNRVGVMFLPAEPEIDLRFMQLMGDDDYRASTWTSNCKDIHSISPSLGSDIAVELMDYDNKRLFFSNTSTRCLHQAVRLARDVDGTSTTSGTYRKQVKDTTDTLRCGNDYTWVLEDGRTIPINQTEREKEHFDTVIVGCDSIISHLKLVVDPLKADEREKSETIEQGETYQWKITDDKTLEITTEGTHRDTVRSVGGCDSIISILHLTIKDEEPPVDPCDQHPFSINAKGGKVLLAPGNLQYQATTNTWRFAERQFDRIGDGTEGVSTVFWDNNGTQERCNNFLKSETYGGWISVFAWGTSGHGQKVGDRYACQFAPYSVGRAIVDNDYNKYGYGPSYDRSEIGRLGVWGPGALNNSFDTLSGTNRHFDWGYDNEIWEGNVKHEPNTWRTLTTEEWVYLLQNRNIEGIKDVEGFKDEEYNFSFSVVTLKYGDKSTDIVSGVLIYPDDFSFAKAGVDAISLGIASIKKEPYTRIDLITLEKLNEVGVMFLPEEPEMYLEGNKMYFDRVSTWTSNCEVVLSISEKYGSDFAIEFDNPFNDKSLFFSDISERYLHQAVRLARDVYGTTSGAYRKQVKETKDTLRCGNDYTWVLEDGRTIPINQTEKEKEHFDTVIVGCDSIISHLKLVIEHTPPTTEYDTIKTCHFPYTWTYDKEKNLTRDLAAAGDYSEPLQDIQGCDSVIAKLHLKLATATTEYDTIKTCHFPYTWTYDKEKNLTRDLAAAGNHSETLKDIQGCDSLIAKLHLIISDNPTPYYDTVVLCSSGPYTWVYDKKHGKSRELTVTNDYEEPLKDIQGCDSAIMYLHLILSDIKVDQRKSSATIERGESYKWEITDDKTLYITTQGTHRDTVRSVYGCDSIISILTLTVTSTEPYDEPVYDTICNTNTYEWIREGTKIKDITQTTEKGTYRDTIHRINGKDSIYCILYLTRLETKTVPTNVSVCIGKRYDWYTTDRLAPHLSLLVEGDYTNSQTIPFKNYNGCDSIIYTLNITAKNCHDCVPLKKLKPIPPKDVCADSVSFNYMFKYVAGHPSTYSVKFDAKAIADGFTNIEGNFEPENIFDTLAILPVNIPQIEPYIRPWSYKVYLNITDTCGKEYKFTDSLHVFYPSKIIDQHWNDVLALFNSRYNGGYEFSAYQWYIDNSPIYGANRDHYYFPANLSETSKYRALLTRSDDGYTTFTCPVKVVSVEDKNLLDEPYIYVHPTFVPKEEPIIQIVSNLDGNFWIYDMAGKMVSLGEFRSYDMKKGATLVRLPSVQSAYLVYLIPKDKKHIKDKSYIVIVR